LNGGSEFEGADSFSTRDLCGHDGREEDEDEAPGGNKVAKYGAFEPIWLFFAFKKTSRLKSFMSMLF